MSTFADELLQEAAIEVELSEAKARGTLPGQRMKWPGDPQETRNQAVLTQLAQEIHSATLSVARPFLSFADRKPSSLSGKDMDRVSKLMERARGHVAQIARISKAVEGIVGASPTAHVQSKNPFL